MPYLDLVNAKRIWVAGAEAQSLWISGTRWNKPAPSHPAEITLVGSVYASNNGLSGVPYTVDFAPVSPQAGDLIVVATAGHAEAASGGPKQTLAGPVDGQGFIFFDGSPVFINTTRGLNYSFAYKVHDGDTTIEVATGTNPARGTTDGSACAVSVFRGVSMTEPFGAFATNNTPASPKIDPPPIDAVKPGARILFVGGASSKQATGLWPALVADMENGIGVGSQGLGSAVLIGTLPNTQAYDLPERPGGTDARCSSFCQAVVLNPKV